MQIALKLGLGGLMGNPPDSAEYNVFDVLSDRAGFAIDFRSARMVVNDPANLANVYDGDPQAKLTSYGVDVWDVDPEKGINLSASRDFAIAMATNLFPYNPNGIHVYVKFTLNAADSGDQRYVFMVDNAGNDRFALYTTAGSGFRWVTADGASADTEVSSLSLVSETEYRMTFGADSSGRTWIDDGGVQTNDQLMRIVAASPSHVGIGGYPNQVLRVLDGYLAEIAVVCEEVPVESRLTLVPFPDLYGAEGDSHTLNVSFGLPASDFYPALVAGDKHLAVRNAGGSGESTAHMLSQVQDFLSSGVPDIATIYGGSNDVDTVVSASPAPTATVFEVLNSGKLAVDGWVVVNGESRKISGLSGDEITLASPLTSAPTAGDTVSVDTENNLREWVQIVVAAGVAQVAIIGSHYLNFASGGDTVDTEQPLRAACRIKQASAAALEGVPYVDTYAYMRQTIIDGAVVQGDWAAWHQGATDTHLNTAGERILANAIKNALY